MLTGAFLQSTKTIIVFKTYGLKTGNKKLSVFISSLSFSIINKETKMLTNEPVINVSYIHRETNTDEVYFVAQLNEDDNNKLTIETFGTIIGCAVYFKEIEDAPERIVATDFNCSHENIGQFLLYKEGIRVFHLENKENVIRGYITNKGFFLNKKVAMRSYHVFCEKNNLQLPYNQLGILYSSGINWPVVKNKLGY